MEQKIEIVGEQVISDCGGFRRIKRWIKGWHPQLGQLTWGLTGQETIIEKDCFFPTHTFTVVENIATAA